MDRWLTRGRVGSDDGTLDGITLGISEGRLLGWNDGLLEGG